MKIGVIRRILKEDLAKIGDDLPDWLDALLYPLNQFISVVAQAMTNALTLTDNFSGRAVTLIFTHGVEIQIDPQVKSRVLSILPLSIASGSTTTTGEVATLIDSWGWVQKSNGKIGVTFNFVGGSGTTTRSVTLFIMAA